MERLLRHLLLKLLIGTHEVVIENRVPAREDIRQSLQNRPELGLYLHIPFCERICPYCPYNKTLYRPDLASDYARAVMLEIDEYASLAGNTPITSFYIGGGTPATMLHHGLPRIVGHVRSTLNMQCDTHMESHPNHLTSENLDAIERLGIRHLSIGVESLHDRHLKTLHRPYTVEQVVAAIDRAVSREFACVNVDIMFDLPGQTYAEIQETASRLVKLGVGQIATYPLFRFPYTSMGKKGAPGNHSLLRSLRRRRMLRIFEDVFYEAGYDRSSVWAFTKRGVPRYCSVTVPTYVGVGASAASYFDDKFYLNTFDVGVYIRSMSEHGRAIALSIDLTRRMQQAGWLYWRVYETRFNKDDYHRQFGTPIDRDYGAYLSILRRLGFLRIDGPHIQLSDRGSFWLHAGEDLVSIDYVSKLWASAKHDPWPKQVIM